MKPPTTIEDLIQLTKRVVAQTIAMEMSPLITESDKVLLRTGYIDITEIYENRIAILTNEIQVTDLTSL